LDVTASYDEICAKINHAIEHFGGIDVLVNNAGFVVSGVWEELRYDKPWLQFLIQKSVTAT
jgi:NAD(P)-dependent dehydrogenase (short-subunit alcohol dehydrogenase family)